MDEEDEPPQPAKANAGSNKAHCFMPTPLEFLSSDPAHRIKLFQRAAFVPSGQCDHYLGQVASDNRVQHLGLSLKHTQLSWWEFTQ